MRHYEIPGKPQVAASFPICDFLVDLTLENLPYSVNGFAGLIRFQSFFFHGCLRRGIADSGSVSPQTRGPHLQFGEMRYTIPLI